MPRFSIIIPVYNRYNPVKNAIASVLNQTFSDFELIVIDDGSTDSTPCIEEEYQGHLRYYRQENSGVSAARNKGIELAAGPNIAFLDSDDIWLPNKLEYHMKYMCQNPKIHIHQTEEIWIRNNRRVNPKNRHKKPEGDIFLDSLELCLISPSTVVVDRKLFDRYGYFDKRLPACEDYDLWLRISLFEKVGLIGEPLAVKYGGHSDQLSTRYWGMDRFRVYSIIRLLKDHGNEMTDKYRHRSKEVAQGKLDILLEGARKRGNRKFSKGVEDIITAMDGEYYNRIDCQILLEG